MRKVLVTIYNPSKVGGPNISMMSVMNSYLKNKYEFDTITISERLGKILKISVLKRLIHEIQEKKPDIIYVSGLQLQGFYMMLAATVAGYRKKCVLIVHGSACDAIRLSNFNRFIFRYILEPFSVRTAGTTYTVCEEMAMNPIVRNNCKRFGGVIHNAAPDVDPTLYGKDFRNELGLTDNDILLTYTGRVIEDKGISYLLEAMKGLPSNVKLAIVGDGVDMDNYISWTHNNSITNVFFVGKRNDVMSILASTDIYVFPSLHENLPNSLVEACLFGLPVVSTNVGGNPEVIKDNYNGILVNPRSSIELKKAIERLINSKELRELMGRKGKEIIEKEFTQQTIYPKIDALFEKICNGELR